MVAPTRAPQARGVKCNLCKKILDQATWLDQTKLAKSLDETKNVLDLIKQHDISECPCIPKGIQNLLVGSTHFETHRLLAKRLDKQVCKRQNDSLNRSRQNSHTAGAVDSSNIINDCHDQTERPSRFKFREFYCTDSREHKDSIALVKALTRAVDFWRIAMEDQTNPFNSKLALRLGLTHHVIYACYLFKYYKLLDYQLISATLLLNLFRTIEGVTPNAVLHAYYLLIQALLECGQVQHAKNYLKSAIKSANYQDKTHYESILVRCLEVEMNISDENLDELARLAVIKPMDKLQHYYARSLALGVVTKYIHYHRAKSELCFEFYHGYRYMCAMIRRCFESSFDVAPHSVEAEPLLDHNWVKFAICDLVFNGFDYQSNFFRRTGQPEVLELLYNGLNMISYRTGSCYWQSRIAALGANLDLLCSKFQDARNKLDIMSRLSGHTNDTYISNLIRYDQEANILLLLDEQESKASRAATLNTLDQLKRCHKNLVDKLHRIELYDSKSNNFWKISGSHCFENDTLVFAGVIGKISLKAFRILIKNLLKDNQTLAKKLIADLGNKLKKIDDYLLDFEDCQILLETMLYFVDIDRSEYIMLEAIQLSKLFLKATHSIGNLESKLTLLSIQGDNKDPKVSSEKKCDSKMRTKTDRALHLPKATLKKDSYNVADRFKNDAAGIEMQPQDLIHLMSNINTSNESAIVASYLRYSEPNPDFRCYRRAHELSLAYHLKREDTRYNDPNILYHLCESITSNTMRYRWMMYQEQSVSPYDPTNSFKSSTNTKSLGFCDTLTTQEKLIKQFVRSIPENYRTVQLKCVIDESGCSEHLIGACLDSHFEPTYIYTSNTLSAEDIFEEKETTLLERLSMKIDDGRRGLLSTNSKTRSSLRQKAENDIGIVLHDLENELLGPFRIIFCGKFSHPHYQKFINNLAREILKVMSGYTCYSISSLEFILETAPLLNRDEFCLLIGMVFGVSPSWPETKDCFNTWAKSLEQFIADFFPGHNKSTVLLQLEKSQVGLILDKELEFLPFETLPVVRTLKQGIFRIPSLRLLNVLISNHCSNGPKKVDPRQTFFILDPANNLLKTRQRFETRLKSQSNWIGTSGHAPKVDQLESWLKTRQLYLFIGHGAGTTYYNKLCKSRGLTSMPVVRPTTILMGCSSGRMLAEGPELETFGISWVFVFRGAPACVGLLWDVTDADIDRFFESLLECWLKDTSSSGWLTDAVAQARLACQLRFLVGSTPVVYGLPVQAERNLHLS